MEIEVCFPYNCLKNDKKDYVFAFYYHKIARKLLLNAPDEWNDTYPTRIEHGVKNILGKSIYISCYKSFDLEYYLSKMTRNLSFLNVLLTNF